MAFLGTLPCGKICYISINGNAKSSCESYVFEDELKLMLCGARVEWGNRGGRTVAIDASATLVNFHSLVPVFEQRVDNIVGIAYAMDLLDYVQKNYDLSILKGDLLESTTVGDMAHKPAYCIPDSMSVLEYSQRVLH
ncbi:hypothetical protein Pint_03953 [Pistacia integerrima]|uniref:Uncharacterized protein n=1 Tax=Pistacia integerrima TaxID=434235 RepID=A0ACC0Z8C6_9ROSI|nr:hypothetical protein Pint_03953 [Pistacia integerrima]